MRLLLSRNVQDQLLQLSADYALDLVSLNSTMYLALARMD